MTKTAIQKLFERIQEYQLLLARKQSHPLSPQEEGRLQRLREELQGRFGQANADVNAWKRDLQEGTYTAESSQENLLSSSLRSSSLRSTSLRDSSAPRRASLVDSTAFGRVDLGKAQTPESSPSFRSAHQAPLPTTPQAPRTFEDKPASKAPSKLSPPLEDSATELYEILHAPEKLKD